MIDTHSYKVEDTDSIFLACDTIMNLLLKVLSAHYIRTSLLSFWCNDPFNLLQQKEKVPLSLKEPIYVNLLRTLTCWAGGVCELLMDVYLLVCCQSSSSSSVFTIWHEFMIDILTTLLSPKLFFLSLSLLYFRAGWYLILALTFRTKPTFPVWCIGKLSTQGLRKSSAISSS